VTSRQGRKRDIYQMKPWNWFPDDLSEARFPDVSEPHGDVLDWKPSHCNFLLPSGRIVCMSLLLEHDRADGLAVGTTHSSILVSRDNGTHGTSTAVNRAQHAESVKLKTPSVWFVIHSNEQTQNIISLK